jgi:hypothetical protein
MPSSLGFQSKIDDSFSTILINIPALTQPMQLVSEPA